MNKFEGLPANLKKQVNQILEEDSSDKIKAAKFYRIRTVFLHKGMIAQLLEISDSTIQVHLKGIF